MATETVTRDMIENGIVTRTVEDTSEPDKHDVVWKFMLVGWNHAIKDDSVYYKGNIPTDAFEAYTNWFASLDERFHFAPGTTFDYYKWACLFRNKHMSDNFALIKQIRFLHGNIIHKGKKIHTNLFHIIWKDGLELDVPMNETIDYSLQ